MKTTTKVHRQYQPLTTTVTLEITSDGGLVQQYDASTGTFYPDRKKTPLVIRPIVNAVARDGSWENGNCNGKLSLCQWRYRINSSSGSLQPSYGTITTNTSASNGTFTFVKNIESGTTMAIWFEAALADDRTNSNIEIKSDELILTTNEKAIDEVMLSFREPINQVYDPFMDKRLQAEWAKAQGASVTAKTDSNSYLRRFTPLVHIGTTLLDAESTEFATLFNSGDISYKIEKYNESTKSYVDLAMRYEDGYLETDYPDVTYVEPSGIEFNCLVMGESEVYRVTLDYKGELKNSVNISFTRNRPAFDVILTNKSPIDSRTKRRDEAVVTYNGGKIEVNGIDCSESVLDILWLTSTKYNTDVEHCYGREGILDLSKVTIGKEVNGAGWLETSVDCEFKGRYEVATDESGEIITDNNDIAYII